MLDATHRVPVRTVVVVGRIEVAGVVVQVLAASSIARTLSTRPQVAVAANVVNGAGVVVAITLIASAPCITREIHFYRSKKSNAMYLMAVV